MYNTQSEYLEYVFDSGIRLVFLPSKSDIFHLAFMFLTGTRNEFENENGMAHLCEHMLFKGTNKLSPYSVLSRMEQVGADVNAFTTKEDLTIHSSFLKQYFNRAVDFLCDISFNSVFNEKEFLKEKQVVIDEIKSYRDIPSEQIFEDFESMVFSDSSLGRSILGSEDSLESFTAQKLKDFWSDNFQAEKFVICAAGNLPFDKVVKTLSEALDKYSQFISRKKEQRKLPEIKPYRTIKREKKSDNNQVHLIVGGRAPSIFDENMACASLLAHILGGDSMTSKLNLALRERHALAYNVECFYYPYFDTGIFGIYLGTDRETLNKSLKILYSELEKIKNTPLSEAYLKKAKLQIICKAAMSSENILNKLLGIGKSVLVLDKAESFSEFENKINKIDRFQIVNLAQQIFDKDKLSELIYI